MRASAGNCIGSPSAARNSLSFFSSLSLRRHQVASLEPSGEEELKLLDLLHSRLAESLQSLLPSFTLSFPFLHKLLDAFLACESDFNSLLLSRNPSLVSHPPFDRSIPDLLDRLVKSLDLCNAVSLSLDSLLRRSRYADIAASALRRPQLNRARRALSKLLSSAAIPNASSSSCHRIRSTKRHLQAVASSLTTPRNSESGSASVLSIAVYTISSLLHFSMWVLVASFCCGRGEIQPAPPFPVGIKNMPWALALSALHDKIGEITRRERREGGLLEESLAVERSGREVFEMTSDGEEELEGLAVELAIASQKLGEGLVPFERKVREVFHRLVWCREELIRCLGHRSCGSSLSSVDSV